MSANNALRIGVVGPAFPYRGGIAQFLAVLCSELEAKGHTLRAFNFTRQYPSFLFPGRAQTTDTRPAIALESGKGDFALGIALGLVLLFLAFIVNWGLILLKRRA